MPAYERGLRPCLALAHRTPTTKAIMNRALKERARLPAPFSDVFSSPDLAGRCAGVRDVRAGAVLPPFLAADGARDAVGRRGDRADEDVLDARVVGLQQRERHAGVAGGRRGGV